MCAVVLYKLTVLERMGGSTAKLLALHEAVVEVSVSGWSGRGSATIGEACNIITSVRVLVLMCTAAVTEAITVDTLSLSFSTAT